MAVCSACGAAVGGAPADRAATVIAPVPGDPTTTVIAPFAGAVAAAPAAAAPAASASAPAAPAASASALAPPPARGGIGFAAIITIALLALLIAAQVLWIRGNYMRMTAYRELVATKMTLKNLEKLITVAEQSDTAFVIGWVATWAAGFLVFVMFLIWLRLVYGRLADLGAERRYGAGQAIWSWFVPILNLFRPYQVAADTARGSGTGTGIVTAWWIALLGTAVIATPMVWYQVGVPDDPTLEQVDRAYPIAIAGLAASIPVGILAIIMVYKIARAQRRHG